MKKSTLIEENERLKSENEQLKKKIAGLEALIVRLPYDITTAATASDNLRKIINSDENLVGIMRDLNGGAPIFSDNANNYRFTTGWDGKNYGANGRVIYQDWLKGNFYSICDKVDGLFQGSDWRMGAWISGPADICGQKSSYGNIIKSPKFGKPSSDGVGMIFLYNIKTGEVARYIADEKDWFSLYRWDSDSDCAGSSLRSGARILLNDGGVWGTVRGLAEQRVKQLAKTSKR